MSAGNRLCFSTKDGSHGALCFCVREGEDAGKLVFKRGIPNVYISWEAPNKDLDICAYWIGYEAGKVGWSWGDVKENDTYYLRWYGDDTGVGGQEHLLPDIKSSWESEVNHMLRVHLNYYAHSETGVCTIKVVSSNGEEELVKNNVTCGERGGKATVEDPYVDILFDNSGRAVSITQG